jgi:predicted phosphate transport protein (TIGR00153 family)
MFSRFLPKEEKFFELFSELANEIVDAAKETRILLGNLEARESQARKLKDIEHRGDKITQRTIALLRTTFITPLDRDDMHRLVSQMDSILDSLEAAGQRIFIYDLRELPEEATRLADICVSITQNVCTAIRGLANLKTPDVILKACVEINRLENEADTALRDALARLFREEKDTRQLIKVKEIYEMLEEATDRCEDVADIVDRIVLEHV